jgi:hypothetical protein
MPAAIETKPARTPSTTPRQAGTGEGRERRASALGTTDEFCHIVVGGGSYTRCGMRLKPPLRRTETHAVRNSSSWCPNHNPSCPECGASE